MLISKKNLKNLTPPPLKLLHHYLYNKLTKTWFYFTKSSKRHTYAGFPLSVYIFNQVSKQWYDRDWVRGEIEFLKQGKLKPGALVFDIGAHQGVVALIFSKIVNSSGRVIAVEMDKEHVAAAHINKNNNMARNLQIIHAAIAEKKGVQFFLNDQIVPSRSKLTNVVKSISIDNLTDKYGKPSMIYIDIEGFEGHALRGAKRTLKYYPDFCIEVHANHGLENYGSSIEKLLSYFPHRNYKCYIAPAVHDCTFIPLKRNAKLLNDRFYLIALSRN